MKRSQITPDLPAETLANDAWFAGLADGEGCFQLRRKQGVRSAKGIWYVNALFTVSLRADDVEVLRALKLAFGGTLHAKPVRLGANPQYVWHVNDQASREALVVYFDRFPLRSKKARDYAIWREAVLVLRESSGRDPRLPNLREALMDVRVFREQAA